ncbi:MAG: RNA polymerase sigma factor [Myxococcota bacterium]
MLSDQELMLAFIKGDQQAFRVLYERFVRRVFSMAYRFSRDYETSKDITQEVFLRLYQKKNLYNPQISFNTFFYRLAYNCILNYIRDHQEERVNTDATPIALSTQTTPEQIAGAIETFERIEKRIDALPTSQKTAFILNKIEGLSYNEVAEIMDTNINTIKSLIHRATMSIIGIKDE